ncbi:type IV secretion system protein VirD4 [Desulfofundulus thermosubterraneus DSM 16057]|uniref:Type IV secretion system protein VirD4 n=2 Tax=Desulfofundulus TaxID=2282741 RepID=A0A1M6EV57_9FIRM|nr:type IV secretion system protein VirD4 [Desulfofundulus thermosubterraneus DSM 16057]
MRWSLSRVKEEVYSAFKHMPALARGGIMAGTSVLALGGLYLLDVWTLGTAAAWLHGLGTWLKGQSIFATPAEKAATAHAFDAVSWYAQHPLQTAWAWLTKRELANPGPRKIWLALHGLTALAAFSWWLGGRFRGGTGWSGIRMKPGDATHGSARWAVKADLARVCDFGFGPGIILGAFGSRPVRIPVKPKTWMNKHVLVVGAPGSGKSRGYVRPNIFAAVRARESVIVTDPKGELYRDMAAWLRTKGYAVRVLNLVRMEESDRWNPLTEIRTPLDADVFAQVVIATTDAGPKRGGDSFWDRAEQNLLKALALYVVLELPEEERHMGSLYDILASGDPEKVDAMFAKLPVNHPAKGPYNVYAMAGQNVRGGVVIGLGTRLQVFQQELVRQVTCKSDIDLALPGREKCAYFLITPDTHGAFDFLASLFFTFEFVRLVEAADARPDGRLQVPVKFLLDEFANIVTIPEFEKKIATVRSRGIECHVIVQSLPQLERVYGRTWQEIKACCDTTLVIGVKDDYTAQYFSRMLGQCTVETQSATREVKSLFGPGLFDDRQTRSTTGRELMRPEEIIKMRSKFCLAFLPDGTPPAKLRVLDYENFPEAKDLKRLNRIKSEAGSPEHPRLIFEEPDVCNTTVAELETFTPSENHISYDASSKTATEEKETTSQSGAVRAGVPW